MTELLDAIDVEAICGEDEPPRGSGNETIEIGLAVVNTTARARIAEHRVPVRPRRSTVSPFCTELTGRTQAEVDGGVAFAEARRALAAARRRRPALGRPGRLRPRTGRAAVSRPGRPPLRRAAHERQARLRHRLRSPQTSRYGMAPATAGLPLEGRRHSGADDSWNFAAPVPRRAERQLRHPERALE